MLLSFPVNFTNPKTGSFGGKEVARSEGAARSEEKVETEEPSKTEENNGGIMDIKTVKIEKPEELNLILGHSHFIKTVEDIYETMVNTVPGAKFGLAFCES